MQFRELRKQLKIHDIDHQYLAKIMNRSSAYISQRMTAKASWTLEEAYFIMEQINAPVEQMHMLFPQGGKYAGEYSPDWCAESDVKETIVKFGELLIAAAK